MSDEPADDLLDRIADYVQHRFLTEAPPPPEGMTVDPLVQYIRFKAFGFLVLGPDVHTRIDALGMPGKDRPARVLELLRSGCEQLVEWRGFSADNALQEIGIGGFTELRMLLHFDVSGRTTSDLRDDVFLDAMHLKHVVDGREITLYNAVDHKKPPPADCPYCGQPLRTAKAKQCRACGTDWHDPENIVRRSK